MAEVVGQMVKAPLADGVKGVLHVELQQGGGVGGGQQGSQIFGQDEGKAGLAVVDAGEAGFVLGVDLAGGGRFAVKRVIMQHDKAAIGADGQVQFHGCAGLEACGHHKRRKLAFRVGAAQAVPFQAGLAAVQGYGQSLRCHDGVPCRGDFAQSGAGV